MGGGVCDVPSAFALLVFLARSFHFFFACFPKKLMDYLGPGPPTSSSPSNQVIRILQPQFDDVATVAFVAFGGMIY